MLKNMLKNIESVMISLSGEKPEIICQFAKVFIIFTVIGHGLRLANHE